MTALVGIIMGSTSDWETMRFAAETLEQLGIPHDVEVVSAHRTPDKLFAYAETAEAKGLEVIIAGAGGAAHLPGMTAAKTALPVLGVPVQSKALNGMDSLLSIVQMPAGIPVGTVAIGKILSAGSAPHVLKQHCRLRSNPGGQGHENCRSRWRYPLTRSAVALKRQSPKQFSGCRSRDRKPAVGCFDKAAPQGEYGSKQLLHPEIFQTDRGPDNINDGINRTDFVEVNLLNVHPVYRCFRFSQAAKD